MFEYTCPACATVLKSKTEAPLGRKIRCKHCSTAFVARPDTLALAPEPAAAKKPDDDNDVSAYVLVKDAELDGDSENRKVKYGEVKDKFKRSARGPAIALLVLPTNLLVAEGVLTVLAGILTFTFGVWPLIFTEVEASEDDVREQAAYIIFGMILFFWGSLICIGASKMQNLESYTWGIIGSILGILPLLAGVFALVMLKNPKVIEGFSEIEGALNPIDEETDDEEDDDDDEDED